MKGGVILFRGTGGAARRYLESDRSTADEYYLGAGTALAAFAVLDRDGNVTAEGVFTPEQYADWVDWRNPFTGATRGTPRLPSPSEATTPGERRHAGARRGSPRFAEMVINAPKSLSIAAALHPQPRRPGCRMGGRAPRRGARTGRARQDARPRLGSPTTAQEAGP